MIHKGVELYNVHELFGDEQCEGKLLLRIPNDLRLTLNKGARIAALACSGCEARFNLRSESARVVLKSREGPSIAEVYQGCFFRSWHPIGLQPTEISVVLPDNTDVLSKLSKECNLPFDAGLTRVILPCRPAVELIDIEGDFELPRPEQTPSKRYLAYGSSITHFSSAVRPTGCFAQKTAQFLGFDVINLGFGGGGHVEPAMADYIAGRGDWDVATLETGTNLIWYIEADEFAKRVEYFLGTITASHPDKWVFCTDLFTCELDYQGDAKIAAFRDVVRERVEALKSPKVVYVSGTDILRSPNGLTVDLYHPSPFGMEEMAANLSRLIRERTG